VKPLHWNLYGELAGYGRRMQERMRNACNRKRRYLSLWHAGGVAHRMNEEGGRFYEVHAYLCLWCGRFHVGALFPIASNGPLRLADKARRAARLRTSP
jgi:hypothetical protein